MKNVLISLVIPVGSTSKEKISLYMQKRETPPYVGLWEFPGGKIESNETPLAAAQREFLEECGVTAGKLVQFKTFNEQKEDRNICFFCYLMKIEQKLPHFREFEFPLVENSQKYAGSFPDPNYGLIDEVIEYLADQVKCGDVDKLWT